MNKKGKKWVACTLVVPTTGGEPVGVQAWKCDNMAIRRANLPLVDGWEPRKWIVFYMPTGLVVESTDTRKEAEALALAFAPVLAKAAQDLAHAVVDYRKHRILPTVEAQEATHVG